MFCVFQSYSSLSTVAAMAEYSDDEVELSELEDESDDEEEKPVEEARKDAIYNTVGMHDKLEEVGWPDGIDWIHSLRVDYKGEGDIVDVNDDLGREMSFYTQGLDGAREAYLKLQTMGVPFLRPADYYAEMIKSDTHMLKVKDKLLFQKKIMEETEERRKQREAKKFGKEVQAEKLKERAKQKKHDIESVKKWRKVRSNSDYTEGEDDFPIDLGEGAPPSKKQRVMASAGDRSGGKGRGRGQFGGRGRSSESSRGGRGTGARGDFGRGGRGGSRGGSRGGRSSSRDARDSKFGFGGRKGSTKRNTADSAADESSYRGSFKGNSRGGRGRGRGRGRS